MTHRISITTVEALVLKKALWLADLQNDTDRFMADRLFDKIKDIVDSDLNKQKGEVKNDKL